MRRALTSHPLMIAFIRSDSDGCSSREAIAVSGATLTHMERELNGELERRLGGGTVIHVSHAVGGDAHTSTGQLYSVMVLIERP
jgi:hypothetical protein